MKRVLTILVITSVIMLIASGLVYAGKDKTWATVGKGLAIYEGVKVLTGREGNIIQDVTGGMKPAGSSSQQVQQTQQAGSYTDGYNAGYKEGYEEGYNAGFRAGIEHDSAK